MTIETVYRTADGEIWESTQDAEAHQRRIEVWSKVLDKYGMYGELRISYQSDFLELLEFIDEQGGLK